MTFREALREQRWDDHRYYHHSRVNQSLHLVSALSFIAAYVLLFIEPALAVLVGWLFAMPSRQVGHFFFEPKGYDQANHATHEFKEQVKVATISSVKPSCFRSGFCRRYCSSSTRRSSEL